MKETEKDNKNTDVPKNKKGQWKGGVSYHTIKNHYLLKKNRKIKLEMIDYICEECTASFKEVTAYAYHVNKNKDDHSLENIKMLCGKCIGQHHPSTNKHRWGRFILRGMNKSLIFDECPNCKINKKICLTKEDEGFILRCVRCNLCTTHHTTEESAIEEWNTKTSKVEDKNEEN